MNCALPSPNMCCYFFSSAYITHALWDYCASNFLFHLFHHCIAYFVHLMLHDLHFNCHSLCIYLTVSCFIVFFFLIIWPHVLHLLVMWTTTPVDVWSVGCIVAEMIRGRVLFPGTDRILPIIDWSLYIISCPQMRSIVDIVCLFSFYSLLKMSLIVFMSVLWEQ